MRKARRASDSRGARPGADRVRGRVWTAFRLFTAMGILGGFGCGLATYVREGDFFRVRRIRVAGASQLDVSAIVRQSGITSSDNLLFLDNQAAARRVEENPYVNTCRVTRVLPDTVEIVIEERAPIATLLVHNRTFSISADGVVIEEIPIAVPHPGPLITDVPGLDVIEPGQKIDTPALPAAFAALSAFAQTDFSKTVTVSEVSARHENDIRMFCDELPFEIRWGRGDFTAQARRLDVLWKYKGKTLDFSEYCDLRFGRDVACR